MNTLPAPPLAVAALVRSHFATPVQPLPAAAPGITWVVAANGIFKRGVSATLDVLIAVERRRIPIPGLIALLPHVRWQVWPGRLPGRLLVPLLHDAQRASGGTTVLRPIEKQYFFVWRDDTVKVVAPRAQLGTAAHLEYAVPEKGAVLCDIHSHHEMPAYFSATDDRDDVGLSVSVVVGRIFTTPEIMCRLNVYGHRLCVPAPTLFDSLGTLRDAGGHDANTGD